MNPAGSGKAGSCGAAELDLHLGPLGHPQRVVARLGVIAEQRAHLVGRLQVVLVPLELEAPRVGQDRPGLHAEQGVVGLVILAVGVVRVVGRQQRGLQPGGDLEQLRVGLALRRQPVVLQLDEQVVAAEDLLQAGGLLEGAALVALQQRLQDMAAEASRGGDQPVVVLGQQVPVEAWLVVVALQEGPARELDQVAVAGVALGQQREVVVELLAALRVATGVVDAAAAGGPLAAVVVGHVRLGADDRLDALAPALLVELQRPVHVAVVGDPERRLAVGRRLGHQLVQAGRPVEHRELGVDVEVGE